MVFDHQRIEKKWSEVWEKEGLYSPNIETAKKPFYNLWMFPYPSAEGLHAGHALTSTASDVIGRFMRMNGHDVFQPMGFDSFGIHPENYALKTGEAPQVMLGRTIKHYKEQFNSLGLGYDWTKSVTTSDPDYYRFTQWLFVQMFKAGLAYRKKAEVNYCPSCKTVLADEQVMSPKQAGKDPKNEKGEVISDIDDLKVCERCGYVVQKKELEQWFWKITKYADRLLEGLDKINWTEKIKVAQRNWIGRSEGRLIKFGEIEVFTTRPDTINGVTFIAVSQKYGKEHFDIDKLGDTGIKVKHPVSGEELPVWVAEYVVDDYGTGAIMGVPDIDERDEVFAKANNLPIKKTQLDSNVTVGEKQINYHLRDWLVSRQRYWGAPIPMIYCERCNWQVEENLPVLLPEISDYKPEGSGRGPLDNHPEFYETKCPKCGGKAKRETDVMDTFVDSCWYFLRYPSVGLNESWNKEITKKWLPVNLYFGGAEHAVLHLMYSRFVPMVMHDLGFIDFDEPFTKFFAHGLMIKDGAKMSKSRGNVVNPDEYIKKYGADTLRMYLMFMGPIDGYPDFRDTGIEGMHRFVKRLWNLFNSKVSDREQTEEEKRLMHKTIRKVTKDIKEYKYNTAIASIMEYVNFLSKLPSLQASTLSVLCQLIAPFAPFMCEEVWRGVLGNKTSVHLSQWPIYDENLCVEDTKIIPIQVNGKLRGTIEVKADISVNKEEILKLAKEQPSIQKWIVAKKIKSEIYVEGRLVNLVVD